MPRPKKDDAGKAARSKATFDLPADLLEEVRAVMVRVPLIEVGGSLSGLVERALAREVERLRKQWNDGKPFKPAPGASVPRGRPPRRQR